MIVPFHHDGKPIFYLVYEEGSTEAVREIRKRYKAFKKKWPDAAIADFTNDLIDDFDMMDCHIHVEMEEPEVL